MRLHFLNLLQPAHVKLDLTADSLPEALQALLALLRNDPRISDFPRFQSAILESHPPAIHNNFTCITIAHCRIPSIHDLVMAAGRPTKPIPIPQAPLPIRLVFIAGIPAALNNEYLRLIGAIARICSNPSSYSTLMSASTPQAFIETLDSYLNQI